MQFWRAVDSPKKRINEFVLFAKKSEKANKTNSFVRFLGESTAHQSAFGFLWPFLAPRPPGFWDPPSALLEGRWDGGLTIGSPSPSLISILRPTQRCTVIEIFFLLLLFSKLDIKTLSGKVGYFWKWRSTIFLSDPKSYFWLTGLLQHWCLH